MEVGVEVEVPAGAVAGEKVRTEIEAEAGARCRATKA